MDTCVDPNAFISLREIALSRLAPTGALGAKRGRGAQKQSHIPNIAYLTQHLRDGDECLGLQSLKPDALDDRPRIDDCVG